MIKTKEINIRDKELFKSYLIKSKYLASEFTFTNFFIWRDAYRFSFTEINEYLCVFARPQEGRPFSFLPIGEYSSKTFIDTINKIKEYFNANKMDLVFERVEIDCIEYFDNLKNVKYNIIEDRNNSDYIYNTSELILLSGKKLHGKRNHINKFNKHHTYEYKNLDKSLIDDCKIIMDKWCVVKDCACNMGEYCERHANEELLSNLEYLDCSGGVIVVDGIPQAFSVGEMQNDNTAVIHIEKANYEIQGLFPLINREFCKNKWENTKFINREQDLGEEGIRKAKLSYNPTKILLKYNVEIL